MTVTVEDYRRALERIQREEEDLYRQFKSLTTRMEFLQEDRRRCYNAIVQLEIDQAT